MNGKCIKCNGYLRYFLVLFSLFFLNDSKTNTPILFDFFLKHHLGQAQFPWNTLTQRCFFFYEWSAVHFWRCGGVPTNFFFWPVTMTFGRSTRRKYQCVISSSCFFQQGSCNIERPIRSHWKWALRVMNQTRPDHQMAPYCNFGADTLKRLVDELKLVKGAAVSNGRWGRSSAWENIGVMPNILQIGVTCPYLSNCGNEGGGITCALRLLVPTFPKWIEELFFFMTVGSRNKI